MVRVGTGCRYAGCGPCRMARAGGVASLRRVSRSASPQPPAPGSKPGPQGQADTAAPPAETAQTLDRGLQVLQLLGSSEGHAGLTISQLAVHLGVGRAVVYRLVATLVARDFATRAADGRVRLGPALSRLAVSMRPVLVEVARPVLRDLAERAGATAHLTIAEAGEALALVVVEPSWTDFHVAYRIGSRHPLRQGAAGRAILAGRTGSSAVVQTAGELQSGAHGLAAPVQGVPGLEASVGVVALQAFASPQVAEAVTDAAQALALALTGPLPAP